MLRTGGDVDILANGVTLKIDKDKKLPDGPFAAQWTELRASVSSTDACCGAADRPLRVSFSSRQD